MQSDKYINNEQEVCILFPTKQISCSKEERDWLVRRLLVDCKKIELMRPNHGSKKMDSWTRTSTKRQL